MGSFEQFTKDIQDEDKRKKLYNATIDTYDFGDYDQFSKQLGFDGPISNQEIPINSSKFKAGNVIRLDGRDYLYQGFDGEGNVNVRPSGQSNSVAMVPEMMERAELISDKQWVPRNQEMAEMTALKEQFNEFRENANKGLENAERVTKNLTQEGRDHQKAAEMTARIMGVYQEPLGLTSLSPSSNEDISQEGDGSAPLIKSTNNPILTGVKMVDGEMKQVFMLPDGTETTDLLEVDKAKYSARQERSRQANLTEAQKTREEENMLHGLGDRYDERKKEIEQRVLDEGGSQKDVEAAIKEDVWLNSMDKTRNLTLSSQLSRAHRQLDEINRKIKERTEENRKKHSTGSSLAPTGRPGTFSQFYNYQGDEDIKQWTAAKRQIEERIDNLEKQREEGNGQSRGFWRGVGDIVRDFRTWDFGLSDLKDATSALNINNKIERGEDLTEAEKDRLNAMASNQQSDYEGSWMYRMGQMSGEMLPFMLDFAIMGGSRSGTSSFSRGLTAYLMKNARKAMPEVARNKVAKWTLKVLGTMPEDLLVKAPLMTNTVQAGKTTSDIIDRRLGDVKVNEDGTYDFSKDKDWGSAIWQGEANAIIENYSEMFGTHLEAPVNKLGELASKGLGKVFGAGRMTKILSTANSSELANIAKTTRQFLQDNLGVSDYLGEVGEEYYGQLWRSMLSLDDAYKENPDGTRTNLLLDPEFHGDIWGGMALSMGMLHGGTMALNYGGKKTSQAVNYMQLRHNVNKTDKLASSILTPEIWEGMKATIDGLDNEHVGEYADRIMNDPNMSDDARAAVMNYMEATLNMRGFNLGSMARQRDGEIDEDEAFIDQSYMDGYSASDPQEMNDIQRTLDSRRKLVESSLSPEAIDNIDADPLEALKQITEPELRQNVLDYVNAKMTYDGMMQRINDDIDNEIVVSDAMVNRRTNRSTGKIQPAIMKVDNREVYIIDGNVIMFDDGTAVDASKSDQDIWIVDAATGKLEMTYPGAILRTDGELDPQEQKEVARQAIIEEKSKQADASLDGVIEVIPGESYSILTPEGEQKHMAVLWESKDDNGNPIEAMFDVEMPDGTITSMSSGEIQNLISQSNEKRVQDFENERKEENSNNVIENIPPSIQAAQEEGVGRVPENADLGTGNVLNVPENVPNDTQNVPTDAENVPIGTKPLRQEEPKTAFDRIPTDEETGKPKWHAVEPEVTLEALVEKSNGNEDRAVGFARMQLENARKTVKEAEKIKITNTDDIDEFNRQSEDRQRAIDNAAAIAEHWQRVLSIPEERKAAVEAEAKAIKEAEDAERRALKKADESLAKAFDEVKEIPEALEVLRDLAPKTMDEVAAVVLSTNKLMWNDEGNRKGVKSETGFGEGERRKLFSMFASRDKGGKSLQKLAEDEMQQMCRTYGVPYDNQEARNALIDMIATSGVPSDISKYVERRRAEQALGLKDAILQREAEAEEEFYQTNYGMSKRELEAYEEMRQSELADLHENFNEDEYYGKIADELADIEELKQKGLEEMDKNFNPTEYYGNIADELANQERIENERRDTETGGYPIRSIQENGRQGAVENDVRGREVLSGEEADKPRGSIENEGRQQIFGGNGQESIDKDADVSGGPRGTVGERITEAEAEVNTQPTEAQKEAGNYKKGHVQIGTFDVTIENPKGSVRNGKDRDGKEWSVTMQHTYGYIRGTKGVDGDHIDVYASSDIDGWNGRKVFVIDQYNPDGTFDEHKVMLGFNDKDEAYNAYLSNYEDGWENGRRIDISEVSTPEFEKWIDSSKRKTKPFAEYKTVNKENVRNQSQYFTEPLNRLISIAKEKSQGLVKKIISPVSSRLQADLLIRGIDIDDTYKHVIDNYAINHALKKHAGETERKRGQMPLEDKDFENIEEIVTDYDSITIDRNGNKEIIKYQKTYPDGTTYYVEEVRSGRKELAMVTMYKHKNTNRTDENLNEPTSHTPKATSDLTGVSESKDNTFEGEKQEINEPRKNYGKRMARESGKSLFDWADEEQNIKDKENREGSITEMDRAGEEANRAIDEYADNFSKYLRRSEEIEKELSNEEIGGIERLALEQEQSVIEEIILDEKERLMDSLREFYVKNNTPEDAEMLSREMSSRVQAEVSVRLNGRSLLEDLLTPAKEVVSSREPISEMKESKGEVKAVGGQISYVAKGHLPDGERGEFSYVERQFLRSGAFSFTGSEKIQNRGDVAYIFKELENYAIENVFAVMQKGDGTFKIVHIGMGTPTSSPADLGAIRAAYDAFGAEKIWFVHNHPSGILNPSGPDQQLMRKIEDAFRETGVDTEGIIMDTRSGRYSSFHGTGRSENFERDFEMEEKPVDVYSFDRMDRSNEPVEKEKLNQPFLVVNYISKMREGKEPRVSYLLLNNQMEVMGNFHTDYKEMGDPALAEEMASVGIKYGAKAIIPYGNVDIKGVRALNEGVKNYSMGDIRIVDALHIDSEGRHETAYEAGLMESEGNYGKDIIGRNMTAKEASETLKFIKENPAVLPDEIELTQESWEKEFGKDQKVKTPLTEVKLSKNQFAKMNRKDRKMRMSLIKPTLENPDIILEENDPKEGALRDSKLLFIKTFIKPDGTRHLHFESVSVKQPGAEVVISNHEIQERALKEKMQNNKVLHLRGDMPFGSEMRLTETPEERPDLLPTSGKSTRNKVNEYPNIKQGLSEVRDSGEGSNYSSNTERRRSENIFEEAQRVAEEYPRERAARRDLKDAIDKMKGMNWLSSAKSKSQAIANPTPIDKQRINLAEVEYLNLDNTSKELKADSVRINPAQAIGLDLDATANIIRNFENPKIEEGNKNEGKEDDVLFRQSDTKGNYSNEQLSELNDIWARPWGESFRSLKQRKAWGEKERERMKNHAERLGEKFGLDIEIIEDSNINTEQNSLTERQKKAKGWYNPRTGKITVIVGNHISVADIESTILHEGVAHHGLRELMGEHFDEFLDKVYESAEGDVRTKINSLANEQGLSRRVATEEYLASLAETTDFEHADTELHGWFNKIKEFFIDMLFKAGFKHITPETLGDNELRYILWRSYQNLAYKGRMRGFEWEAEDVAMRHKTGVLKEQYPEKVERNDSMAAEEAEESLRYQEIQNLQPIEVKPNNLSKEELKAIYSELPKVKKDGREIEFYKSAFKKVYKDGGLSAQAIPALREVLESSILAYSEPDNLGGQTRKDGTEHKEHKNILSFDNYVGKIKLDGKEYYVRFTVQNEKERSGTHSFFVSNVDVYEKPTDSQTIPITSRGTTGFDGIPDTKLAEFFERAKENLRKRNDKELEEASEILFRDGDFTVKDSVTVARYYEDMLKSWSYQFREAMQDSMLGLKKVYEAILQKDKIEDVAGYENAYLYENRMSSTNAGEQQQYYQKYIKPLLKAIYDICGKNAEERRALTDYMMAKHGLERNEYMRNEAAKNKEKTDRDFAGLTALTNETDWNLAEQKAQDMVDQYEADHDMALIDELWIKTREATQATLTKLWLSGIISEETLNNVSGMYDYYIPLRGWEETTSDEVYGYLTSNDGPLLGSVMKSAEGRSSKADDPIATIAMMADDAIRQGNRNIMKQRFLNFVWNHPSDLVSVNELWLVHNDVTDEWEPAFAELEPDMTPEEVAVEINKFEENMNNLATAEPDKYKRSRQIRDMPYKVVKANLKEHMVLVKRNGRTYVMTINGNPKAAQALNGLTNPDVETGGVIGNMLKGAQYINRQLSAFYTTRNPDFVVGNFLRDMLYSNGMTWVKENPRYALRFHKNFGRVNPINLRKLIGKWENGTINDGIYLEKQFKDFMLNGGETGYTNVKDIEGHKRTIAKELKKQGASVGCKAWRALGLQLDMLNRSAENCARFAAFLTSREMGRSLDRSIYDAKEISVNFNKKGSGGKMVNATGQNIAGKVGSYISGGGRIAYVFWNAGIQGMTNFGRAFKRHPAKAMASAATLFSLGIVIPLLAKLMGGGDGDDDDANAYYNLPEYIRRSNICFKAGDQWITIPLPIEYRAIYGLGEMATGVISGNERYSTSETAMQVAAQFSQLLPLDMLEGGGGVSPLIPSSVKPFTEAYIMNKGWTGLPIYKDTEYNKNVPEWNKAYASTDQTLVDFTRWLNQTTGGDDYKKGKIDINPAKLEYLLNGTLGGMVSFPAKIKKSIETPFTEREFEWRNTPIANRVVKSGDERTANRKLQNEYYNYSEEVVETKRLLKNYEKAADKGIIEYAEKINFLWNSPEMLRYEIFEEYESSLKDLRQAMKDESDREVRKELERDYYIVMREMIDDLHKTERKKAS